MPGLAVGADRIKTNVVSTLSTGKSFAELNQVLQRLNRKTVRKQPMPVIVRADGFHTDTWTYADAVQERAIVPWEFIQGALSGGVEASELGTLVLNTTEVDEIRPCFDKLKLIVIPFPSFADGRGFSLARRLRQAGFSGVLRAQGHMIADQFKYALQCGFDEVEISDELAERQPQEQWLTMKDALSLAYQPTFVPEGQSILERRKAKRG
jgi:uncharacterized protein (DUF934 family)